MNQRQAMREASRLVANAAYRLAEETGSASLPHGEADRERIENALLLIANRLDRRAEGRRKKAQAVPLDPNQVALFE